MNLSQTDRQHIRHVINSQLRALSLGNGQQALSFSSPERQRYGSGERFLEVVQAAFPQLVSAQRAEYGALRWLRGRWMQQVTLIDEHGGRMPLVYVMVREPGAGWFIDGCVLLDEDPSQPARPAYLN